MRDPVPSPSYLRFVGIVKKAVIWICNAQNRRRSEMSAGPADVRDQRRRLDNGGRFTLLTGMDQLNQTLFALINGPADPAPATLILAQFLADWVLYLVAAGLVIGWLRAGAETRRALVRVALTMVLALAVNFTIAALWYHPRPFELGIGNQLIAHAPETSFPSDHATILFAVAFSLFAFSAARLWAWLALVAAVAVSWARVWLGIHWPLDMLGSIVVALGAVWIAALVRNTRGINRVTTFALNVFDRLLDLARIPPRWVQRSGGTAQ